MAGFDPTWSPDGTRIAFVRDTRFEDAIGNSAYTVKVDGSDMKLVVGFFPRALDPDWANGSDPVREAFRASHARAVGAAVEAAVGLDAVPDHLDVAVLAGGGKGMDRALETVECMRASISRTYLKSLVVVVSTDFALGHGFAPFLGLPLVDYSPVSQSQSVARLLS